MSFTMDAGSFWSMMDSSSVAEPITSILHREHFELEDVLDHSNLLQELSYGRHEFTDYLCRSDVITKLIHYVIASAPRAAPISPSTPVEPLPTSGGQPVRPTTETSKYHYLACEVLAQGGHSVTAAVLESDEHLCQLFSIFDTPPPLDPSCTGYFRKVTIALIQRNSQRLVEFLTQHKDVFNKMMAHIGLHTVMELLIMLGWDNGQNPTDPSWLIDLGLPETLLKALDPKNQSIPDMHTNASRALVDVLVKRPTSALVSRLETKENIDLLFKQINSGCASSLTHATSMVILLTQRDITPSNEQDDTIPLSLPAATIDTPPPSSNPESPSSSSETSGNPDDEDTSSNESNKDKEKAQDPKAIEFATLSPLLQNVVKALPIFTAILAAPPILSASSSAVSTSASTTSEPESQSERKGSPSSPSPIPFRLGNFGLPTPAFGEQRMKTLELFGSLFRTTNPSVAQALVDCRALEVILGLFLKFPWNNLMHALVESCVCGILDRAREGEDETQNTTASNGTDTPTPDEQDMEGERLSTSPAASKGNQSGRVSPSTKSNTTLANEIMFSAMPKAKLCSWVKTCAKYNDEYARYRLTKTRRCATRRSDDDNQQGEKVKGTDKAKDGSQTAAEPLTIEALAAKLSLNASATALPRLGYMAYLTRLCKIISNMSMTNPLIKAALASETDDGVDLYEESALALDYDHLMELRRTTMNKTKTTEASVTETENDAASQDKGKGKDKAGTEGEGEGEGEDEGEGDKGKPFDDLVKWTQQISTLTPQQAIYKQLHMNLGHDTMSGDLDGLYGESDYGSGTGSAGGKKTETEADNDFSAWNRQFMEAVRMSQGHDTGNHSDDDDDLAGLSIGGGRGYGRGDSDSDDEESFKPSHRKDDIHHRNHDDDDDDDDSGPGIALGSGRTSKDLDDGHPDDDDDDDDNDDDEFSGPSRGLVTVASTGTASRQHLVTASQSLSNRSSPSSAPLPAPTSSSAFASDPFEESGFEFGSSSSTTSSSSSSGPVSGSAITRDILGVDADADSDDVSNGSEGGNKSAADSADTSGSDGNEEEGEGEREGGADHDDDDQVAQTSGDGWPFD